MSTPCQWLSVKVSIWWGRSLRLDSPTRSGSTPHPKLESSIPNVPGNIRSIPVYYHLLCTNKVAGDSAWYHPDDRSLRPSWRDNNKNREPFSSRPKTTTHTTSENLSL